jgi:hypothetical protein
MYAFDAKTGYPLEQTDGEANKKGTVEATFTYAWLCDHRSWDHRRIFAGQHLASCRGSRSIAPAWSPYVTLCVPKGIELSSAKVVRVISRVLGLIGLFALLISALVLSPKIPGAGLTRANTDSDASSFSLFMLQAAVAVSALGAVLLGWRERKIGISALVLVAAISRYLSLAGFIY